MAAKHILYFTADDHSMYRDVRGALELEASLPRRNMTTEGCPEAWPEDAEQLFKNAFFHRARALR